MRFIRWYYSTWFIGLLFSLWFLIIPLIFGIILLSKQRKEITGYFKSWEFDKQQEFNNLQEELFKDVEQREKAYQARLENEVLNKQREVARLTLLSRLKIVAIHREMGSAKKQQEDTLQENKVQHQKELEKEVLTKQKEIDGLKKEAVNKQREVARLTLLTKLKTVAMRREIESVKKQQDKILQENKVQHQRELEKEVLTKQKEKEGLTLLIEQRIEDGNRRLHRKNHQLRRLKGVKNQYMKELVVLKDELLYQSFGFYDIRYDLEDSQEYKKMLDKVRSAQKEAVKNELAVKYSVYWQLNNSSRQGEAMNKKNIKMTIRSFNNECDAVIHKVKFNNVEASEKKIRKARAQIDKLNQYNAIEITDRYLDLKLEELYLAYEYAEKKLEEREEQRRHNELLREERRVLQEIEERRKVLLKEEQHYKTALDKYLNQLENADDEGLSNDLKCEIEKTEKELKKIEEEKSDLDYRVRNAKAGYVYVISNLGAFGENVYKIGMTRRLEPEERIRELSAASVPFVFDVHAMIFSEDAPALENALHKTFHNKRVNKVNNRKEFFRVSLKEIEKVVRENYNKPFEFTKLGMAQEYRETMMIEKEESKLLRFAN